MGYALCMQAECPMIADDAFWIQVYIVRETVCSPLVPSRSRPQAQLHNPFTLEGRAGCKPITPCTLADGGMRSHAGKTTTKHNGGSKGKMLEVRLYEARGQRLKTKCQYGRHPSVLLVCRIFGQDARQLTGTNGDGEALLYKRCKQL